MVWHIVERARSARLLDRVVVATDDERIRDAVEERGGEAVMTSPAHLSGTDRVAEAVRDFQGDVVVNIQGDEPMVDPAALDRLVETLRARPEVPLATLRRRAEPGELEDPNVVKVVTDAAGRALYFSRAPIPYPRQERESGGWVHVGIYAFRRESLLEFAQMPPSPLERAEGLEQLRALEAGWTVQVLDDAGGSVGVDTPSDLERARALLEPGKKAT